MVLSLSKELGYRMLQRKIVVAPPARERGVELGPLTRDAAQLFRQESAEEVYAPTTNRISHRVFSHCLFGALGACSRALNSGQTALSRLPVEAQAAVSAAIGRSIPAYVVRVSADGLHAENVRQDLIADFGPDGVAVRSGQAQFHMQPRGYGYEQTLKIFEPVVPQAFANRVEYRRGQFTEWYVNGPMGLEQGFTIQQTTGDAHGQPLTVALSLAGNLTATVDASRTALTLSGKAELKYGGLTATDARGEELPAWLELQDDRLLLRVDDAKAIYPVTIDPCVQLAKLTASDGQPYDGLGLAVAIDGDALVVGVSNSNRNEAYVFVKPSGGWGNMTQTAILTPSDSQSDAAFGVSVSISGDTIAVAAPDAKDRYRPSSGAVYVFVKPAGGSKSGCFAPGPISRPSPVSRWWLAACSKCLRRFCQSSNPASTSRRDNLS